MQYNNNNPRRFPKKISGDYYIYLSAEIRLICVIRVLSAHRQFAIRIPASS